MLSKHIAQVDRHRCVACGACAKVCPRQAIAVWRGCWASVDAIRCVGCGKCGKVCPADAVTLEERGAQA